MWNKFLELFRKSGDVGPLMPRLVKNCYPNFILLKTLNVKESIEQNKD